MRKINQSGFSLVLTLLLAPLLVSTSLGLATVYFVIKRYDGVQHACRTEVLQTQGKLKDLLEELLSLNPQARVLRQQRQAAEVAYKAALVTGLAHVIVPARMVLTGVKMAQAAFGARQKAILVQAKIVSARGTYQVWQNIRRQVATTQSLPRFGLRVVAQPPHSPSPDYRVIEPVTVTHHAEARWSIGLEELLPKNLRFFRMPHRLHGACAATIERSENRWSARMAKASARSN